MKYPQRGHTISQRHDSSRLEQTGQNWAANSTATPSWGGIGSARDFWPLKIGAPRKSIC